MVPEIGVASFLPVMAYCMNRLNCPIGNGLIIAMTLVANVLPDPCFAQRSFAIHHNDFQKCDGAKIAGEFYPVGIRTHFSDCTRLRIARRLPFTASEPASTQAVSLRPSPLGEAGNHYMWVFHRSNHLLLLHCLLTI